MRLRADSDKEMRVAALLCNDCRRFAQRVRGGGEGGGERGGELGTFQKYVVDAVVAAAKGEGFDDKREQVAGSVRDCLSPCSALLLTAAQEFEQVHAVYALSLWVGPCVCVCVVCVCVPHLEIGRNPSEYLPTGTHTHTQTHAHMHTCTHTSFLAR
jgi:hypothetical protein